MSSPSRTDNLAAINEFLQCTLRITGRDEIRAVEAARWLDAVGLLRDSQARPGLPLRDRCRDGRIVGAEQRPSQEGGRWFIRAI